MSGFFVTDPLPRIVIDNVYSGSTTVKLPLLVPVPPELVTAIGPEVAPEGTGAVICVAELTEYEADAVPLNFTALTPVKFAPVIVTEDPTGPVDGEKLVITGSGNGEKFAATDVTPLIVMLRIVSVPCASPFHPVKR